MDGMMPFGDLSLDAPLKPNKGQEGGACNVRSCQAEPAIWWNHGSYSWYCEDCANQIGNDPVNYRDWEMRHLPKCGHAMFETREQIDRREAHAKTVDGQIERITAPYFGWDRGRGKPQGDSLARMLKGAKRRV